LEPARAYKVRLIADDGESSNLSPMFSFSAPPAPPVAVTGIASAIETGRAHVQGTVNPEGSQATYHFVYGTTTSYGSRTPAFDPTVGTGRKPVAVGVDITDLAPGTVYHYRLVADGPGGQVTGEDRTFETLAAPSPARAYELVSAPTEKGNVSVEAINITSLASVDGNEMMFSPEKASYPGSEATPYIPRVSAFRTDQGWKLTSADPPQFNEIRGQNAFLGTLAVSADQTRAVVVSRAALAVGAVAGQPNMYIRNLRTDEYKFVATGQLGNSGGEGDSVFGIGAPEVMIGGSADLSTIAFMGGLKVSGPNYPHSQAISTQNIYKWNENSGLSLLSVLPNGAPSPLKSEPPNTSLADPNQVSSDGKRIYFSIQEPSGSEGGLYLSEDGKSILVSVSHVPGDPKVPVPASFKAASADGRYVIFSSERTLTTEVPSGVHQNLLIYRYDAETGELSYLAEANIVAASRPQTGEMYYSKIIIGEAFETALFHLRDGVSTEIADVTSGFFSRVASPNGRYLAFISRADLTGFESGGVEELYLYDADKDELTCTSCRADGKSPTGPARIGVQEGPATSINRQYPRAVLDDGTVFFDTPDPLVPGDSNGQRDVYSYRDGQTTLISRGDHSGGSEFVEANPDGKNVFFRTIQQLVPQDDDQAIDLYDARVGGGFAATEDGQDEGCGAGCVAGPSVGPVNGSETTPATPKAKKAKPKKTKPKKCQKKKKKKGGGPNAKCHKQGGSKKKNKGHSKKGAGR
jgi:hypothetical protein